MTALKQLLLMVLVDTCLLILSSAEEQKAKQVEPQMATMEEVSIHESKWGVKYSSIDKYRCGGHVNVNRKYYNIKNYVN